MPRKKGSGSSPEKPAATSTRRNTRRGRNKSEEPEEIIPPEIPPHLLKDSSSSEQSDNDSDYGSPKKGRGRGKATGRGRKPKETPAEEKPTRGRRGRRGAAARDASPEEPDNSSQTTQETAENEPASEPVTEDLVQEQESEQVTEPPAPIIVTPDTDEGKVSEVTIEQESNNDQAPVNEEESDDVETGRETVDDVNDDVIMSNDKVDDEEKPIEEESKDEPESSNQSESRSPGRSRSHSSEREVTRERSKSSEKEERPRISRSSSGEIREESNDKMEVDAPHDAPVEAQKSPSKSPPKQKPAEPTKPEPEKAAVPIQRKRKWTARKTDDQPVIAITTDSLKTIISEEVKPVPLSDVKLLSSSPEPEPEEKRARSKPTAEDKDAKKKQLKERLRKQEEEEERRNEQLVKAIDKSQAPSNGATTNGSSALLKDRKVSLIVDAQPSPPKNESSSILYITNLVRPFTVLQLKGLLARTGRIVENGFWIDKIKSKCYVKYETEDEAVETRHALHGVTWPASNPKCLNVDFGNEQDMEKAIVSTLEDLPQRIQITTENRDVKEEKEFGWSKDPYKTSSVDDRSRGSHARPVREWDVGKKEKDDYDREDRDRSRRRRSSERENRREKDHKKEDRPERHRSMSDSPGRKVEKPEGEGQPVRLLDDLFRKTKATPCIYWLPLSAEQIVEKEEQRQKNLAENERRMEEARKQREERMREREKRRSNSRDRRRDRSRDRRRRSVSRDRRYRR